MKRLTRIFAILCTVAVAPSAAVATPFWDLLAQIEYNEKEQDGAWLVEKSFPPELVEKKDDVTVIGYYVPIEAQAYVRSFVMVPTPADCPFCGSGGYGISLEVQTRKPMPDIPEGTRIRVRGTLMLIDNEETYQAVIMTDAALVE